PLGFFLLGQFGHALLLLFFLRLFLLLGLLLGDLGDLFLVLHFRLRHGRRQHPHRGGRRRLGFRLGFFFVLRRSLLRVLGRRWRRRPDGTDQGGFDDRPLQLHNPRAGDRTHGLGQVQ